MPQIPTLTKRYIPEGTMVSTGPVEKTAAAYRRMGAEIADALQPIGEGIGREIKRQREREQQAKDSLEAVRMENGMRELTDKHAESYAGRLDYENFDKDYEKQVQDYDQFMPKGNNPMLQVAFERSKGQNTNFLRDMVRAKKYTVMTEEGKIQVNKLVADTILKYNLAGEQERQFIKRDFDSKLDDLKKNFVVDPLWIDTQKRGLMGAADYMRARQDIINAPALALDKLNDLKTFYPNLDPTKQPELMEHGFAMLRTQDTLLRQQKTDLKQQFDEIKQNYKTKIFWEISKRRDVSLLMDAGMAAGLLDSSTISEVESFQKRMLTADDKPEDPVIKSKLTKGIYGSAITVSEKDLDNALGNGINTTTYQTLLGHRTTRIETERKERQSESRQRLDKSFEHGERYIETKFTMEGPGAAIIDREAKSTKADALREYRGLVYGDDKMDPDKALDTVVNRYGRVLDGIKDRESKKLRRSLMMPNNETATMDEMILWLDKNKPNLPKATYDAQVRMLRDIKGLEQNLINSPSAEQQSKKKKYKVTE